MNGIDENNMVIDYDGFVNIYMKVYFDVIVKGVFIVMVFYFSWNGIKMYVNWFLFIDVFKG